MSKILIVSDVHCRDFYKPILQVKDVTPIVFMGDYMDPYSYEGTNDEDGIENLEEIIDFAKNNNNVTLLVGNHDVSFTWSYHGIERTDFKYYQDLHKLYRDNINLFKPCLKRDNVLFTHAGVSNGWVKMMNSSFEDENSDFRITQDNIDLYIGNEFEKELEFEECARFEMSYPSPRSPIFCIGRARWGDAPYGGPFWDDFNDEYHDPERWNLTQIFSHTQCFETGRIRKSGNGYCVDSRAIFEYDIENKTLSLANFS